MEFVAVKESFVLRVSLLSLLISIFISSCTPQNTHTTLGEQGTSTNLGTPVSVSVTEVMEPSEQSDTTSLSQLPLLDEIPLQPRPDYINGISPPEYSIVPWALFEYDMPDIKHLGLKDVESGFERSICVDFFFDPLVEPNDYIVDSNIIVERMTLLVNGEVMRTASSGGMHMGTQSHHPAINAIWVSGHDTECWEAPLRPGRHEVKFQFVQTSGTVAEYVWYFQISK